MAFSIDSVRAQFPALREGGALFDAPGGTQTPASVANAIATAMTDSVSQRGRSNFSGRKADRIVLAARQAMADLLGAEPTGIVFGRSATQLTFEISEALCRNLGPGDEVVVSRLDHDANIRPWVTAAEYAGATVRWIGFDRDTADLRPDHVRAALTARTRVVAVTGASNMFGTRTDVRAIADAAHEHGALFYLDAVALTPHAVIDLEATGADFIVCSPYKFCGPHLGVLASTPQRLETTHPTKLRPSTEQVPERFELGTLPYEVLAGVTATVDFLASIAGATGTRRDRLAASYAEMTAHEGQLFSRLLAGLENIDGVTRIGRPEIAVPTVLFRLANQTPRETELHLGELDIAVMSGTYYCIEAADWCDLPEGGVRAGLAPYTSADDVDRLLEGVAHCAAM